MLCCAHFPLRKRTISKTALIHQSSTMASAIPMTPIHIHFASRKDRNVRHTTVANRDAHIVNFTSPAALRPEDSGPEKGYTNAENRL